MDNEEERKRDEERVERWWAWVTEPPWWSNRQSWQVVGKWQNDWLCLAE